LFVAGITPNNTNPGIKLIWTYNQSGHKSNPGSRQTFGNRTALKGIIAMEIQLIGTWIGPTIGNGNKYKIMNEIKQC
jgi:hypothetical protein